MCTVLGGSINCEREQMPCLGWHQGVCNHLAPPLQIPVIPFPLLMLLLEQVPEDECEALGSSERC